LAGLGQFGWLRTCVWVMTEFGLVRTEFGWVRTEFGFDRTEFG